MRSKLTWRRPLLTVTQLVVLALILAGLFVALDLKRRAQEGRLVGADEAELQAELDQAIRHQTELTATLTYVQSDDYVAAYARDEGGYVLPGEKRIVPMFVEAPPVPTPPPPSVPDPAHDARPWQLWWRLLTDAPIPTR